MRERVTLRDVRAEVRPMLSLAWPVVLAELGWMGMGLADTVMVGRLGAEAIGAVGLGSTVFLGLAIFGIGMLLGLDTLVSQAFGARRIEDCHRWLLHGVYASLILTLPLTAAALGGIAVLQAWGVHPDVLRLTVPYMRIVTLSVLPLLLYATFRRYLQAIGLVKPVMFALVTANAINIFVNWVLIFGRLGAPALGSNGAAWATCASRVYMALALLVAIVGHDRRTGTRLFRTPRTLSVDRLVRLGRLGTPAAVQVLLEVGVFTAATVLAGTLDPVSLAAHQIALNLAATSFMVPLGVASAGAVRVGHAVGRGDPGGAARAGWAALAIGAGFMTGAAMAFLLIPGLLVRAFTPDAAVLSIGVALLAVAALFQLFDGIQGVATGVLRGLGDTRTPMLWSLVGHWLIGLPISVILCFAVGWGVIGLWLGLSSGLIVVGVVLLKTWARQAWNLTARGEPARVRMKDAAATAALALRQAQGERE